MLFSLLGGFMQKKIRRFCWVFLVSVCLILLLARSLTLTHPFVLPVRSSRTMKRMRMTKIRTNRALKMFSRRSRCAFLLLEYIATSMLGRVSHFQCGSRSSSLCTLHTLLPPLNNLLFDYFLYSEVFATFVTTQANHQL